VQQIKLIEDNDIRRST